MIANRKISNDNLQTKRTVARAIDDWPEDFDSISIRLASTSEIKDLAKRTACKLRGTENATWPCPERKTCDCGEVKKAETINYRSFRPEPEGLFCEAIFGPQKDWECNCGKYKRIKHKGMICDRCGVEITQQRVRRDRLGYIQLAAPVSHIWYFKGLPSRIGLFCGLSSRDVERVLYFEGFIVVEVTDPECPLEVGQVLTEAEYVEHTNKHWGGFRAGTGAEVIREILSNIDLQEKIDALTEELAATTSHQKKLKVAKQLKQMADFAEAEQRPEWMILDVIPVIPPDLRPLVPLEGGRFATSDLNDLYRRVINRNNRLRKLIQLRSPEVILRNEKRMLQEAVDAFFDNGRHGRRVTGPGSRPLKSLAEVLKGKIGRFRQNLLGKRVDYSGRSVIVVGPELGLHQCGIPKRMAVELFKPFIIERLKASGFTRTIKRAKHIAEHVDSDSPVWEVIEEVIADHPVLLNRPPTLHRLGIQAFIPVLVEGQAIRLPPLACKAFDADFDGDQVSVHVPLTLEAQAEAMLLMLASHNICKPANGEIIAVPQLDMTLGLNFLTKTLPNHITDAEILHQTYTAQEFEPIRVKPWHYRRYSNLHEVPLAYESGRLKLHDSIQLFFPKKREPILTTVGRVIFNGILPKGLEFRDEHTNLCVPFFNAEVNSQQLAKLVERCHIRFGTRTTVLFLEHLQRLGFEYATRSGLSPTITDYIIPVHKERLLRQTQEQIAKLEAEADSGEELVREKLKLWFNAVDAIENDLFAELAVTETFSVKRNEQMKGFNPVHLMVESGACNEKNTFTQISATVGLKENQNREINTTPIRASYREGLNGLDYFRAAAGVRNHRVDRVIRIPASGHLTRRLVNVAMNVIITEIDCGTQKALRKFTSESGSFILKISGRTAAENIVHPITQKTLVNTGSLITQQTSALIENVNIKEVKVRSILTCQSEHGVCAKCYGTDLTNGRLVNVGEAIGIIAAQSIGELSMQALFTRRYLHSGCPPDIVKGIPRLIELFEARSPKKEGAVNPYDILKTGSIIINGIHIKGEEALWTYLIDEIQKVYQTGSLNDKHIEVIVRQMSRKIRITEPGDTQFSLNEEINKTLFHRENQKMYQNGRDPAEGEPILQNITKATLNTESFLAAASFEQTKKALIHAALRGKKDPLHGLRENMIAGKLIPAGTGFKAFR